MLLQAVRDAWESGDPTQVRRQLVDGADPCAESGPLGWTALHEAARWGHAAVVGVLLEHGAPVNAADDAGRTPLYVACAVGHAEAAGQLLKAGARADCATTTTRWTALHAAADRGHSATVQLLLDRGAAPSLSSTTGQMPRDLAREKHHSSTVRLFDRLSVAVMALVAAQQRLAWARVGTAALSSDLMWSVGSLTLTGGPTQACPAPAITPGHTSNRVLAQVGARAASGSAPDASHTASGLILSRSSGDYTTNPHHNYKPRDISDRLLAFPQRRFCQRRWRGLRVR